MINLIRNSEQSQLEKLREIYCFTELVKEFPAWPIDELESVASQSVILKYCGETIVLTPQKSKEVMAAMCVFSLSAEDAEHCMNTLSTGVLKSIQIQENC